MAIEMPITAKIELIMGINSVDLHPDPDEIWILLGLDSGWCEIWSLKEMMVRFWVSTEPIQAARFVAREWVVSGDSGGAISVHQYGSNVIRRDTHIKAHQTRVTCLEVYPGLNHVLSAASNQIKVWDTSDWECIWTFEDGNTISHLVINPDARSPICSVSVDNTIKIWKIGFPLPQQTFDGCAGPVKGIHYARDHMIIFPSDGKVLQWNFEPEKTTRRSCKESISAVCVRPEFYLMITGSTDCTVRFWRPLQDKYILLQTCKYSLGCIKTIRCKKGSSRVVFGCEAGFMVLTIGKKVPVVSMDNRGKILWARPHVTGILTAEMHSALGIIDLGRFSKLDEYSYASPFVPQGLKHSPDGRFVAICWEDNLRIDAVSQQMLRSYSGVMDFAWSTQGEYAIMERPSNITIYRKESKSVLKFKGQIHRIFGGTLLSVCFPNSICFLDWADLRRIETLVLSVKNVFWADSGNLVAISSKTSFVIYKYRPQANDAFELLHVGNERAETGIWVGDCFIYSNSSGLSYYIGGQVKVFADVDRRMQLLGFLANRNMVYMIDREYKVTGYLLPDSLVECMTRETERATTGVLALNGATSGQQGIANAPMTLPTTILPPQLWASLVSEPGPCELLILKNMFDPALLDAGLRIDLRKTCSQYGDVEEEFLVKTSPGDLFVRFGSVEAAAYAYRDLHNQRLFNDRQISAIYVSLSAQSRAMLMQTLDRSGSASSVTGPATSGGTAPMTTVHPSEPIPSKRLRLRFIKTFDEQEFDLEYVYEECSKHGVVKDISIKDFLNCKTISGDVHVLFERVDAAVRAHHAMHNQRLGNGSLFSAIYVERDDTDTGQDPRVWPISVGPSCVRNRKGFSPEQL